jgi:putative phosphoesterase
MHIAILSDTHSRNETVAQALRAVRERGIDTVLHCGDIEDVDTVRLFADFTAHFVYGNSDAWNRADLRQAIHDIGATLHEPFGDLELEGKKIAFLHSDDKQLMHDVEHSGHFDYLFYGHTHQAKEHRTGPTRVINPGALHRARPKTFVVLDLATGVLESVVVAP